MPRKPSPGLPTRKQILDFIEQSGQPAGKREIARAFGLSSHDKIMLKRPNTFTMDIENLDIYYEDCVIGGPGAFVVPIRERDKFKDAIRTKLVLDIADRQVQPRVVPVAADAPRISCSIGEQMWQRRWGGGGIDFR